MVRCITVEPAAIVRILDHLGEPSGFMRYSLAERGFGFPILYYAGMESSRFQATLGKQALGIKVTDDNGVRLSFGHALGRWFAAALSYLTLYIGACSAPWRECPL